MITYLCIYTLVPKRVRSQLHHLKVCMHPFSFYPRDDDRMTLTPASLVVKFDHLPTCAPM